MPLKLISASEEFYYFLVKLKQCCMVLPNKHRRGFLRAEDGIRDMMLNNLSTA